MCFMQVIITLHRSHFYLSSHNFPPLYILNGKFGSCRGSDFSRSGFGPRTIIICDQVIILFLVLF